MSKSTNWLALDIGGANLKIADGVGFAAIHAFSLWRDPHALVVALRSLISGAPPADHVAVTMTGELADCYQSKTEGVTAILNAVERAVDGRHTRIYRTDGKLVSLQVALRDPAIVAAANWHALARFAGRLAKQGNGLVIDIGSTTTDIIGLKDGEPAMVGMTDTERLASGELVYTGVLRTPMAAIVRELPYRGKTCRAAAELFATMLDAYLLLDEVDEEPGNHHTADGRSMTKTAARGRLARMICADRDTFNYADAVAVAAAAAQAQRDMIATAAKEVIERLGGPPQTVVVSGRGEFLARRVAEEVAAGASVVALSEKMDAAVSVCAPAHALAVLAREMNP